MRTVLERDPAARSALEVVLCYPGVHAIWIHRVAHALWRRRLVHPARALVAHVGRFFTGIEIHPAAMLGPGLFIDHGMGIVIGETAEVGENVSTAPGRDPRRHQRAAGEAPSHARRQRHRRARAPR